MGDGIRRIVHVREDSADPDPQYCQLLQLNGIDRSWPFWRDFAFRLSQTPSILELGAGCGNLSSPLAKAGIDVTAVDSDPNMIAVMESSASPNLTVIQQDFRTMNLHKAFDLILIKSVLLNLFDDTARLETFETIFRHLKPQGVFVAEVYQPEWLIAGNSYTNEYQHIFCKGLAKPGRWEVHGHYYIDDVEYRLAVEVEALSFAQLSTLATRAGLEASGQRTKHNPITELVEFVIPRGADQ